MPVFQHQGRTLHYTIENNAFHDDVLFLHGHLGSTRWWQPTIQFLERSRELNMRGRLVAMDWPGCGESLAPLATDDLTLWSLAKDHIGLVKSAGLSQVNLVGHSSGGLIALIMMLLEPDLFSRAVLLDPVPATGMKFSEDMIEGFKQMSQDRRFCEVMIGGSIFGRETSDSFVQKLIDDAFGVDAMVWAEFPRQLGAVDVRKDLPKIEQPIFVLHGEHDRIVPVQGAREIADSVVNGEFELLKGRGHSANVEDPAMLAGRLQQFFGT